MTRPYHELDGFGEDAFDLYREYPKLNDLAHLVEWYGETGDVLAAGIQAADIRIGSPFDHVTPYVPGGALAPLPMAWGWWAELSCMPEEQEEAGEGSPHDYLILFRKEIDEDMRGPNRTMVRIEGEEGRARFFWWWWHLDPL